MAMTCGASDDDSDELAPRFASPFGKVWGLSNSDVEGGLGVGGESALSSTVTHRSSASDMAALDARILARSASASRVDVDVDEGIESTSHGAREGI